mgnify:FL=1
MNKTVEQTVARFQTMRDSSPAMYYSSINDIWSMSEGGDPDGIRLSYYQGCDNDFFKEVLSALGEEIVNNVV